MPLLLLVLIGPLSELEIYVRLFVVWPVRPFETISHLPHFWLFPLRVVQQQHLFLPAMLQLMLLLLLFLPARTYRMMLLIFLTLRLLFSMIPLLLLLFVSLLPLSFQMLLSSDFPLVLCQVLFASVQIFFASSFSFSLFSESSNSSTDATFTLNWSFAN